MSDELDIFEELPVALQQAIARGDVTLEDLLDRLTDPHADDLCPKCAVRPANHRASGMCTPCALRLLADAHDERTDELAAQSIANAAKKRLERLRTALEPDRPRARPPFRVCDCCGVRLPALAVHRYSSCVACLERRERRDAAREEPIG